MSMHHVASVVSVDQRLCRKATEVILESPPDSHLKSINVLKGGFHTLRSNDEPCRNSCR